MANTGHSPKRDALLHEIAQRGVTHATKDKPILSRDGQGGTGWVMSFLGAGLREPWLSTASDLLLEALEDFGVRQIATMGMAASPLLAGCVMRSGGAYNALFVRPEPKAHGSGNQIEGLPDRSAPVVIIDDAIGTGHSALRCAEILEADGFEVAGVVVLVRFTYNSGYGLLEERGYRVRALYDLYEDMAPIMEPECIPARTPWRARGIAWQQAAAPDGLSAFALARLYLGQAFEKGALPRPPQRLAGGVDAPGGLWISARDLDNGAPVARAGVWRFDDEPPATAQELLAEACWWLRAQWPQTAPPPDRCGLGLSLMGSLTPCTPGEADNAAFGLVWRSRERPWEIGGALPDMPEITGTAHQLRHALFVNGKLRPREPFELYRNNVTKLIEPGAVWPGGGCSARPLADRQGRDAMAAAILLRVRALIAGQAVDAGDDLFLFDADVLFISIYQGDTVGTCIGMRCEDVAAVDALVQAALRDPRMGGIDRAAVTIQLNVLSERWSEAMPPAFTPGRHALGLLVDGREHILLPGVAVESNLDADAFAGMLYVKAGKPENAPMTWSRFRTAQWVSRPGHVATPSHPCAWVEARKLAGGTPERVARRWFLWLAEHVSAGTLPTHELPYEGQAGDPAPAALYAETIRRLREAAPFFDAPLPPLPLDLLPREPDLVSLAHAHATAGGQEERLRRLMLAPSTPRSDPAGFWRAVEAIGVVDVRASRWRTAPMPDYQRIIRLCATRDDAEADWLSGCVGPDGAVMTTESDEEDTLIAARAAEALAGSARVAHTDAAGRILMHLARLSIDLGRDRAGVRASDTQSGLRTEHTVAALGAFARLKGATR